ncbi:MFS transporter [Sporolactobacillus sp. THM7-7]|nr:MFS transporter [Sporolactobacillus sp. THM7-7]
MPRSSEGTVQTRERWKATVAASLANYLDSGSIVAGSIGLALWSSAFHMSDTEVGLLGAISSNAISAAVGAFIGGIICDKYGRKKIYMYDLLVYILGILILMFTVNTPMLYVGYIITGLAVGADIPASWTLIAERAPAKARGRHSGVAQIFWSLGPVFTLLLSLAVAPLGMLGVRIVFLHLAVAAFLTWLLRRTMNESEIWAKEKKKIASGAVQKHQLSMVNIFRGTNLKAFIFLTLMYGIQNLVAGSTGFFFLYLLQTFGSTSHAMSILVQCLGFAVTIVGTTFIFMTLVDKKNRRVMLAISGLLQSIAILFMVVFELNFTVALAYIILFSIGGGFGHQAFFQLWSTELFPTRFRATAQGMMFSVVRFILGFWSFFVPVISTRLGFQNLAIFLTVFLVVSTIIGVIGAPKTRGKKLEEIEQERRTVLMTDRDIDY